MGAKESHAFCSIAYRAHLAVYALNVAFQPVRPPQTTGELPLFDTAMAPSATGKRARRRSGGFTRGLAIAMLIATVLLLVYINAPDISASLPQADPALNAYVAFVDNARLWLDQQMAALTPK